MTDRDKLIEVLETTRGYCRDRTCNDCEYDKEGVRCKNVMIADHMLADGWMRPPCKVGDKVYCVEYNLKIIEEYTVSGYTIKNGKLALFVFRGIYSAVVSEWFLTQEDAERALRECEGR
jgi:hypothetical protein